MKQLSSDCNFKAVTADTCEDEAIRDAFISGITSQPIRLRLLENKTLDLQTAITQDRSLEAAAKNCESYYQSSTSERTSDFLTNAAIPSGKTREAPNSSLGDFYECAAAKTQQGNTQLSYFCGNLRHPRSKCPAKDLDCKKCGKRGHFAKVCRSTFGMKTSASMNASSTVCALSSIASTAYIPSLERATITAYVNGNKSKALVDTGSSESFIRENKAQMMKLKI